MLVKIWDRARDRNAFFSVVVTTERLRKKDKLREDQTRVYVDASVNEMTGFRRVMKRDGNFEFESTRVECWP